MPRHEINFFWSGDGWTYLNDLTIRSHIKVGHLPVIWIHGSQPDSKYWDVSFYNNRCVIKNANSIIDISDFISRGGNFKTASSLWRFNFLYRYGGWYADTDAVAIKEWPDRRWVICGEDGETLSTGVIRVPPKQQMFLDMLDDLRLKWGNVGVFNKHYEICNGNTNEMIDGKLFYPHRWVEWDNIKLFRYIPDVYSVHLYHTMFERRNVIDKMEMYAVNFPDSMIGCLHRWVHDDLLTVIWDVYNKLPHTGYYTHTGEQNGERNERL